MFSASTIGVMSNFPQGFANGISLRGLPLMQTQPGQIFYLDNDGSLNPNQHAGSDSNRGTYLDPFGTLNGAFGKCQGGRGDIIIVGSGHQETISSATAMALNTSDVAVIGMGGGTSRPQFTLDTAATSIITVTGANISFQNVQFVANFANITTLFNQTIATVTAQIAANSNVLNVTAVSSGTLQVGHTVLGTGILSGTVILSQLTGTAGGVGTYMLDTTYATAVASTTVTTSVKGFALDNCEIRDTSSSLNFLNVLTAPTTSNTADMLSITRSNFFMLNASGVINMAVTGGTHDRWAIAGNYYNSPTTDTGAPIIISTGKILTNFQLLNNYFNLVQTSGTALGIVVQTNGSTNTGYLDGNRYAALDATTPIMVTASSGFRFGLNYYVHTADKCGYLIPAADS